MKSSRAAIRYAKAVLSQALEVQHATEVANDMRLIVTTFQNHPELTALLHNAVVPVARKSGSSTVVCSNQQNNPAALIY